jgi:hypothetical protein
MSAFGQRLTNLISLASILLVFNELPAVALSEEPGLRPIKL